MNLFFKNINSLKDFISYILNHILIILIIFVVFFASTLFLKRCEIDNPIQVENQQIFIKGISLENWGTWFTGLGLIITAFWSVHQYNKSKLSSQQEKAAEIAKDFSDNLIERMGLISAVLLQNFEIRDMIKKIDNSKLNQFTVMEIIELTNDKNCFDKFDAVINSKRTQNRYKKILKANYNKKESERFDSTFAILLENTLNKLEAICMNISSNAAGSQFIYESLHQVFLSTVETLSIKISTSNTNNVDKYYINIISVYNMWNKQKQKDINKLNKTNKKIHKLQKQVDKEIKKLLNKQTKTV